MRVGGRELRAVWWSEEGVRFVDQRRLPHALEFGLARDVEEVARAIEAARADPEPVFADAFADVYAGAGRH